MYSFTIPSLDAKMQVVGALLFLCVLLDIGIVAAAHIYSRHIFNGYLKRHHRKDWEELVYGGDYQGLNLWSFDKTPGLRTFRTASTDDLGDPVIPRMRRISVCLQNAGILILISLIVIPLALGLIFLIVHQL